MEYTAPLSPSGADTPKIQNMQLGNTFRLISAKRRGANRSCSPHLHLQLWRVALACCSFSGPILRLPLPWFLPEAGRGLHLEVAARRRAGFPLLPVRHAAAFIPPSAPLCAARATLTPEVRRCSDMVLPSMTVGKWAV